MIVPLPIASSIEKRVSPGTCIQNEMKDFRNFKRQSHPAIYLGLSPALSILTNADDNIQTVVTGVQALTMALWAITNQSEGIIFEVVLEFSQGPICTLIHDFLCASKVKSFDATNTLLEIIRYHSR